jgi:hypothetical protein
MDLFYLFFRFYGKMKVVYSMRKTALSDGIIRKIEFDEKDVETIARQTCG